MTKSKTIHSKILALGSAFPDKVLTNKDLEKIVDTSDDWIVERTGIRERRILSDGEKISDIAALAAKRAIGKAGLEPNDIDFIISCSNSPDRFLPAMASEVQKKLGITNNGPAWDILAACAGWIMGMSVADQYIRQGVYKNVLVMGAEALSRFMNWEDRTTCVLFGDAAGAAIVSAATASDKSQIFSTHMHTDSNWTESLQMPAGGSAVPHAPAVQHKIKMNGQEIFKLAVRAMADCCMEALEHNNMKLSDVDWLVPHQANLRIIEAVAKKLSVPMDKVLLNVHKYGNTSAATCPTCLDEFIDNGKVKRGDIVLATSFGGGVTWGSALFRY